MTTIKDGDIYTSSAVNSWVLMSETMFFSLIPVSELEKEAVSRSKYNCTQCGHVWVTRPWMWKNATFKPFRCPGCSSRYWDSEVKTAKLPEGRLISQDITEEDIEKLKKVMNFR